MKIGLASALAAIASLGIYSTARAQDYANCPDPELGFQKYKNLLAECMSDADANLATGA